MAQKAHYWTTKRPCWEWNLPAQEYVQMRDLEWFDKIGPLSVRAHSAIAYSGLSFDDACGVGVTGWMRIPNCGRRTAYEIVSALAMAHCSMTEDQWVSDIDWW